MIAPEKKVQRLILSRVLRFIVFGIFLFLLLLFVGALPPTIDDLSPLIVLNLFMLAGIVFVWLTIIDDDGNTVDDEHWPW